jgi:hypothetical protein
VAVLPLGSTLTRAIATAPDSQYLVSLVASFTGSGSYMGSFGTGSLTEDYTMPGTFSFTGFATGTSTNLTFRTGDNNGSEYPANLDGQLESAPAPTPGARLLSACLVLATSLLAGCAAVAACQPPDRDGPCRLGACRDGRSSAISTSSRSCSLASRASTLRWRRSLSSTLPGRLAA